MSVVLDASAVLAVLQDEPGAAFVSSMMRGAVMSTINFSEAIQKAATQTGEYDRLPHMIARFDVQLIPFDSVQAQAAARLESRTRKRGVSFADRACLALGGATGLPILTGDRKWPELGLALDIRLIR